MVIQCTISIQLLINKLICTSSVCLVFALLDCLFSKEIHQQNEECKHHINGIFLILFAKSLKFGDVQMGHSHTCPLHIKLMPTTSLSHILHNEQTRDNTFDYIFHSQLKKIAPKPVRLFEVKIFPVHCDLSCPHMHCYYPLPFSLSLQRIQANISNYQ